MPENRIEASLDEMFEQGYEKLLEAGEKLEREAIGLQSVAREGLGRISDREPTAHLELTEDGLIYLSDYLGSVFGTGDVADEIYAKVRQALAVESNPGGRFYRPDGE